YLTRDDINPHELLEISRHEIKKYGTQLVQSEVIKATRIETEKNDGSHFIVTDKEQNIYKCKRLLVATGLTDYLPEIQGFDDLYGKSIFHCPYCDAWEVRNKVIGVYAKNKNGFGLAMNMLSWSNQVILFTDGRKYLRDHHRRTLEKYRVSINSDKISRLIGEKGKLKYIEFMNGKTQTCDALFFVNGFKQHCSIVTDLNCRLTSKGVVLSNKLQQTSVPGLYVAGDASKDMQFVVVAAAEGAKAAVAIHMDLQKDEREIPRKSSRQITPLPEKETGWIPAESKK
ncbi:MAG TPA: NAD(P)/FAD-dependent oxidoreductase, partial [Parasegetibacter sp.]